MSFLGNVPCACKKCESYCRKVYRSWKPFYSTWFKVMFKSSISLLIFCLIVLCIIESRVLKTPTIIWNILFLTSILSAFASCIFSLCCWVTYAYNFYILLMDWSFYHPVFCVCIWIFVFKYLLYDVYIATPAFSWLLFILNSCFHPFTFKLFVSLNLNYGSSTEHLVRPF